jgi:hypothetical protein
MTPRTQCLAALAIWGGAGLVAAAVGYIGHMTFWTSFVIVAGAFLLNRSVRALATRLHKSRAAPSASDPLPSSSEADADEPRTT